MMQLIFARNREDAKTGQTSEAGGDDCERSAYRKMLMRELDRLPPLAA